LPIAPPGQVHKRAGQRVRYSLKSKRDLEMLEAKQQQLGQLELLQQQDFLQLNYYDESEF
jgi:hypothetical protein